MTKVPHLLLTIASVCLAAIPPLPVEVLKSNSEVVALGVVGSCRSSIVDSNGIVLQDQEEARGQHTKYKVTTFSFHVEHVEKGSVDQEETKTLAYREIILPMHFVGLQGQNEDLSEGDRVRVFAMRAPAGSSEYASAEADSILLEPNGWETIEVLAADTRKSENPRTPPRLVHSRHHGFVPDTPLRLNRTVTKRECPWLDNDIEAGTKVYLYSGYTYGTVDFRIGVAVTLAPGPNESFIELPASALSQHAV